MNIKAELHIALFSITALSCLFGQLRRDISPKSFTYPPDQTVTTITMPDLDVDALHAEDENRPSWKPFRYGHKFTVDLSPSNSGSWRELSNGSRIWRLKIESTGAFALSLEFDRFHLPSHSTLHVYSPDKSEIYGAYTSKNNNPDNIFATPLVKGDAVIVEFFLPKTSEEFSLHLSEVIHDYLDIIDITQNPTRSCGMNVVCPEADNYQDQVNAAAWLDMGAYICSGAMINNTSMDLTPYFLTADHCVEGENAATFRFYFNYETSTCNGSNAGYGSYAYGSILRSRSYDMDPDFALVEITGNVYDSWNVFYAGWTRSASAPVVSSGVHHPGGDPKKINFDNDYASSSPPINWGDAGSSPAGSHWGINWDEGGTEGGSSGSPAFDVNGRIIGQLSGGSGGCDSGDGYYGKFWRAWDGSSSSTRLRDWLDPEDLDVTTLDGTYDGSTSPQPYITVTTPNGGEQWFIGDSENITWDTENAGGYVKIELYLAGSFVGTISNSTSNNGYYLWTIPAWCASSVYYKVKITDTSNSLTYDYSNNNFSITGVPEIIVISPNGGESWEIGSSHTINWTGENIGNNVKIQLWENGSNYITIINSTYNDGNYTWSIPESVEPSTQYKLKINDTSDASIYDFSDDTFSLYSPGWPEFDFVSYISVIDDGIDDIGYVLTIGANSQATNGYDEGFDLYAPPAPPPPAFDAALYNSISGDRYFTDFRPSTPEDGTTEWQIHLQPSQGATHFWCDWNPDELGDGQFFLQDMFGGVMINVNMKNTSSTSFDISFTQVKIIHINTDMIDMEVDYLSDWNIVGLAVESDETSYESLFPNSLPGTLFEFTGTYQTVDDLELGKGYLLRLSDASSVTFSGYPINELTIGLSQNWNLFSGLSVPLSVDNINDPDGIILSGTIYGLTGSYVNADTLHPGKGYWVRATEDGEITLTAGAMARRIPFVSGTVDANRLTFSHNGHSVDLYFGKGISDDELLSYSLPPVFPGIAFDARFAGDIKYVVDSGEIEVLNRSETITLEYDIKVDMDEHVNWLLTSDNGKDYILDGAGELTVPSSERFILNKKIVIPSTFTLHQNFPNPFNPITTLSYDLPKDNDVKLAIFDMRGNKVATLVSSNQQAGFKSVQWDATDSMGRPVSAGVYLYQISAGEFVQTKKMVLLK